MKNLGIIMVSGLLLMSPSVFAQDNVDQGNLTIDAQIRARGEFDNGVKNPRGEGTDAAAFINQRARLSMTYDRQGLIVKITGQETGVWGQDDIKNQKDAHFGLHEAWAKLDKDGWFLQIGRQTLVYDDERLLGGLDWHVAGNHHDAIKGGYEDAHNKVHLIITKNSDAENDRINYFTGNMPYKSMQTLWYHYSGNNSPFQASLLFINLGREAGDNTEGATKYMQTFGTYLTYKAGAFNANVSLYAQTGKTTDDQSVGAWMGSLNLGYAVAPTVTLNAGIDMLSGTKESDSKYKSFNPLYGTHHKFYGAMDYFYASTFMTRGLQDINLGINWKATKKTNWTLTWHNFATAVEVPNHNKGLGNEFDLQFNYKVAKDITLMGGASMMFGTETMDAIKGGDHSKGQSWGWVALNITPRLFTTK